MNTLKGYTDKPYYKHSCISKLSSLSKLLDVPEKSIIDFSKKSDDNYHSFFLETEKNGIKKKREITEPKFLLKKIQKRINSKIFSHVQYPRYLTGGIKDKDFPRDYYSNAALHSRAHVIHCIDVREFYPSINSEAIENIFKNFFKFSPRISSILTSLVTYNDHLPQGAPTSSHLANLIFYDKEYSLVSGLRCQNITYTRLLDDITISSKKNISKGKLHRLHVKIRNMIESKGLEVNENKTKTTGRKHKDELMEVTGLWVNHSVPKCKKTERKNIRSAVKECEIKYLEFCYDETYHELWNRTSGRVAKLQRLNSTGSNKLRIRLSKIYPKISDKDLSELEREIGKLESSPAKKANRLGFLKRVNIAIYKCGMLSRDSKNSKKAKNFRIRLEEIKPSSNYDDFWGN